jgi:uncharacterized surface anchored protein
MLICILSVHCLAAAQHLGHIGGIVLDENGQVFEDADVCLMMRSGNNTAITCNLARTDKSGKFAINNLENGTYGVFATRDAEGYSIQNQSPGEKVELTVQDPAAEVTVRLRPRGGVLLGSVLDEFTGQPLKRAWLNYQDIDGKASGSSLISDGRILLAVPTDCDLVIVVSAEGYKGWIFTDPANPARPVLRLQSGERKTLDVQLEPAPKARN